MAPFSAGLSVPDESRNLSSIARSSASDRLSEADCSQDESASAVDGNRRRWGRRQRYLLPELEAGGGGEQCPGVAHGSRPVRDVRREVHDGRAVRAGRRAGRWRDAALHGRHCARRRRHGRLGSGRRRHLHLQCSLLQGKEIWVSLRSLSLFFSQL